MIDGPMCLPLEKYYGHSHLLYKDPETELDYIEFGNLWQDAKLFSEKTA